MQEAVETNEAKLEAAEVPEAKQPEKPNDTQKEPKPVEVQKEVKTAEKKEEKREEKKELSQEKTDDSEMTGMNDQDNGLCKPFQISRQSVP